jgi:predicted nucleic acid-binding protein
MPDPITVANSSCLIGLELIGRLDLLQRLYGTVTLPAAVVTECGFRLPQWFQIQTIQNQGMFRSLRLELGSGESEAIVLAAELAAARLILDDKKARRIAQQLGLPVTGTLAVLLRAKERGLLSSVREVLDDLTHTQFRISDALVQETLRRAGE